MAEDAGEPSMGAMRSGLHSADGDSERFGDLQVRHAFEVLQAGHGGLIRWQLLDRTAHLPGGLEALEVELRHHHRPIALGDLGEGPGGPAGLAPVDVDRHVLRDGRQPRSRIVVDVDAVGRLPRATNVCCAASSASSCCPSTRCATA